jgi:hypothetical protein
MSERNFKGRAATALLVLTVLLFTSVITFNFVIFNSQDKLGGMYDIYRYYSPLTFFVDSCIHNGEFPSWNPLTYCGLPNVGNPQSFIFYPPHLIRSLLTTNPTPERSNFSLALMMGLHYLFMGCCTYLFGRAHKMSPLAALTAALSFLFSALMVRRMCEYHFITTMAWLPLLLLLVKKMIDARDFPAKMIFSLLAGLTLGMSILGGFLQIINLMGLMAALYGLFYFLLNHDWQRKEGEGVFALLRPFLWNGMGMAIIFILGSGMAVVSLVPSWELGSFTLRTSGAPTPKYSDLWKWTPLDFYQKMVLYTGVKYEAETLRNPGIVALLLAVAGLTWKKRRDTFLFLGLFLLLFECSFGAPLPIGGLLEKVTPFSMSANTRAYDFALLPLSLLAGFGLDAVSRPLEDKGKSMARAIVLLLFALVLIAPVSGWLPEIKHVTVNQLVILFPVLALVLMLITGLFSFSLRLHTVLALLLMIFLFAETFAWNQSFVPYMVRAKVKDYIPNAPEPCALPATNVRRTDPTCNRILYRLEFSMNGVDPMHLSAVRDLLSGPPRDRGAYRGVQDWEVTRENLRGNLLFKRSFWLAKQYAVAPLPGKREYYPAATTVFLEEPVDEAIPQVERKTLRNSGISENNVEKNITQPAQLFSSVAPGAKKTFSLQLTPERAAQGRPEGSAGALHSSLMMWYNASPGVVIDTVFTGESQEGSEQGIRHTTRSTLGRETGTEVPLPDFAQMTARITVDNKSRDPFQFSRLVLRSDLEDEDGLIQIVSRTANTAVVQVGPLEDARILSFLDSWYPGWTVTVDGNPAKMLKVNECFKGVVVPAGSHEVAFTFNPLVTWKSLAFSLFMVALAVVALLFFALLQFLLLRKRRKALSTAEQEMLPAQEETFSEEVVVDASAEDTLSADSGTEPEERNFT